MDSMTAGNTGGRNRGNAQGPRAGNCRVDAGGTETPTA
jgi:hypothetical protein